MADCSPNLELCDSHAQTAAAPLINLGVLPVGSPTGPPLSAGGGREVLHIGGGGRELPNLLHQQVFTGLFT